MPQPTTTPTAGPSHDGRAVWRERFRKLVYIVRIEKQGKYSARRVAALAEYSQQTSALRTAAVVLLTPVPCLVVTLLLELIPLNPPYSGVGDGLPMGARSLILVVFLSVIMFQQFADFLPSLPLPLLQNVAQSAVVTVLTVGASFLVAWRVGSPLPFSLITTSPVWIMLIVLTLAVTWGKRIREQREAIQQPLTNAILVWSRQNMLVCVYPVYYYLYSLLPLHLRTAALFLLPAMKMALRIWYCNAMRHLRDDLLELVIMNVDVFSALFIMYCMQLTPSLATTLGLMGLDLGQLLLSLHDVSLMLDEVVDFHERVGLHDSAMQAGLLRRQCTYIDRAAGIIGAACRELSASSRTRTSLGSFDAHPTTAPPRRISALLSLKSHQVVPVAVHPPVKGDIRTPEPGNAQVARTSRGEKPPGEGVGSFERRYLDAVRRLLYIMEFMLLVHYVEFIIPFIFATYTAAVYHLPNRKYFPSLSAMSDEQLLSTLNNLYLYAMLELLSLVALHAVLKHKLRLPGISQLAFVLEKQWTKVQSHLIFWVLYNAQPPLQHFGFDYTFKFAWLHHDHAAAVNATDRSL